MTNNSIVPVILSGGSGTRMWPASRTTEPKQFLALVGDETMLQATARRIQGLAGLQDPLVLCAGAHRHLVERQLGAIGVTARLIIEPVGRNTAPAVAAAAVVQREEGADPLLLVLPADHVIDDAGAFQETVARAIPLATAGQLVTFGIVPTSPETGYGYIEEGDELAPRTHRISRFVEKPDIDTARQYLETGRFAWNSGMFLFRASRYLEELTRYEPGIVRAVAAAVGPSEAGVVVLNPEAFAACPSDSVDFAVMEHTDAGVVISLDAGWSDVGSWDALFNVLPRDADGNATKGDAVMLASRDSYVHATSRLVAAFGVEDMVVVETSDAVLVVPRRASQGVRSIVAALRAAGHSSADAADIEKRPWGSFEILAGGDGFQVKRLTVHPGAKLSLQSHQHRAEEWVVVNGTAQVTLGDDTTIAGPGETVSVPVGGKHRLANPGQTALVVIEVQLGAYLGEDDIQRYEDEYGRS